MKSLFSVEPKQTNKFGPVEVRPGRMTRLEVGPFDKLPPLDHLHVEVRSDDKELSYISARTADGHMYVYTFENYGQRTCLVTVVVRIGSQEM